jgi:sortase (surface protein transpeptidase)
MHQPLAGRATPTVLAATLALSTMLGLAGSMSGTALDVNVHPAPPAQELSGVAGVTAVSTAGVATNLTLGAPTVGRTQSPPRRPAAGQPGGTIQASPTSTLAATAKTAQPKAAPKPKSPPAHTASTTAPVWWSRYEGTNHVWLPTLSLSKPVYTYACSRSSYPGNVVYRWGCAGQNNVYLFGHNFGVFNALYEAWRDGDLRKGMPLVYADGQGRTRLYRVTSWRVVVPTDSGWAIASQDKPSLTLQTCADKAGKYRLVVRLVSVAS